MFDLITELKESKAFKPSEKPLTGFSVIASVPTKQSPAIDAALATLLPDPPAKGHIHHLVSHNQWSFHNLIAFVLALVGPAKVYLSSWAISENPIRELINLHRLGTITELHCLLDARIKSQCPAAAQLIHRNVTRICLADVHAKVAAIINESWSVSIVSTANLTNKRRIERYCLSYIDSLGNWERDWILKAMEEGHEWI